MHLCLQYQEKLTTSRWSRNETRSWSKQETVGRKQSAPILHYSNHSARFRLLISGDIEINPGPTSCGVCEKTVRRKFRQNECSQCYTKVHSKCITTHPTSTHQWMYTQCMNTLFPFFNTRDFAEGPTTTTLYDEMMLILTL